VRLLLIDDNAQLRRVMQLFFGCRGVIVEEADSGDAAEELLSNGVEVDAVLLDFSLPRRDGLSMLPVLRRLTRAPIILLTGNPRALEMHADKFDAVLTKGCSLVEILVVLQRLTGTIT
jgi:CheY-like chemotaxis protein